MSELPANRRQDADDPVLVFRAICFFVVGAISGTLVFLFHLLAWQWFAVWLVAGGFSGILVGGLLGVPFNSTLGTMVVFAGLFEGLYQGWRINGLFGVVAGGPIGVLCGILLFMLYLMAMSAIVILCGGNPFYDAFPEETSGKPQ